MSRVVGPLKLTSIGATTNNENAKCNQVPPPPRKPTKSLGVRKHHGNARYQLPVTNGGITSFFKKSDGLNHLQSSPSPSCSPSSSPSTHALFPVQTSRAPSPLPSFEALLPCDHMMATSSTAAASMWDSTPPTTIDRSSVTQFAAATSFPSATNISRAPPPAPMRAPKKCFARAAMLEPSASRPNSPPPPPLRSLLLAQEDDDEDTGADSMQDGQESVIQFSLTLCSQPSQVENPVLPLAQNEDHEMFDCTPVNNNNSSSQFHPLQRSSSACSDIVILASQEADDQYGGNNGGSNPPTRSCSQEFPLFAGESKSGNTSQCATPTLRPVSSPNITPTGSPLGSSSLLAPAFIPPTHIPASTNFKAFNESLPAPPVRSLNPFALGPNRTAAAAASQSTNNDMPPPPALAAGEKRWKRAGSTFHAPPQRQGSIIASSQGQGLPPQVPVGVRASQNQPIHTQTTLSHLLRSNSTTAMQGGSGSQDCGFASQLSQTQCMSFHATQNSNSLESHPSMFCTPQDQPIRERTAFEMAEELQLQREHVAWDHHAKQGQQHQAAANIVNTHAPLTASMRQGSGSAFGSNSGILAPPALKKQKFTMTSSGATCGGTDGSTQQMMPVPESITPVENPFLAAYEASLAAKNGTASNTASGSSSTSSNNRNSKKRGFDASSSTSGSSSSSVLSSPCGASTSRLFMEFEYLKQFGLGCYGLVFLVRHRLDGNLYAVKKSKSKIKGPNSQKLFLREPQILAFLHRLPDVPRSILGYQNCWIEEGHLYIQTQWCPGGSLAGILKKRGIKSNGSQAMSDQSPTAAVAPFSNSTLALIAYQLAQALAFMHRHGLVHLDVKPDNILEYAADEEYRLADFGLACSASDGSSAVLAVGDKRYLPVEALEDDIQDLRAVDLFALGCTLYELASGKPFDLPMSQMEMTRIRHGDIEDVESVLDPFLYELIRSLLHSDPTHRRCAADLVRMLEMHLMQ